MINPEEIFSSALQGVLRSNIEYGTYSIVFVYHDERLGLYHTSVTTTNYLEDSSKKPGEKLKPELICTFFENIKKTLLKTKVRYGTVTVEFGFEAGGITTFKITSEESYKMQRYEKTLIRGKENELDYKLCG